MQLQLWDRPPGLPEGFAYRPDLLSPAEETELLKRFGQLDFKPFEFHGYLGNRRVVSVGLHYDFAGGGVRTAQEIPAFLLPLREKAAGLPDCLRTSASMSLSRNTLRGRASAGTGTGRCFAT